MRGRRYAGQFMLEIGARLQFRSECPWRFIDLLSNLRAIIHSQRSTWRARSNLLGLASVGYNGRARRSDWPIGNHIVSTRRVTMPCTGARHENFTNGNHIGRAAVTAAVIATTLASVIVLNVFLQWPNGFEFCIAVN